MKKVLFFMLLSLLSLTTGFAQEAAFNNAVAKYRTAKSATAKATMVKTRRALKKGQTFTGALYMKDPNKVAIVCNGGKEQLVMNGNTFTMVMRGHKRVASAKTAAQFAAFKAVLQSVLSGGRTNISKVPGVRISQSGGNVIVTMTPAKARRMMFSSFVLSIDKRTGALESLAMNSKRGSTVYSFTGFRFGASVNDKVFRP